MIVRSNSEKQSKKKLSKAELTKQLLADISDTEVQEVVSEHEETVKHSTTHLLGELKQRAVAGMAAQGASFEQIATILKLEEQEVANYLNDEETQALVGEFQLILSYTVEERILRLAPIALNRKLSLMLHDNVNVAEKATSYILDQAVGRALQKVESRSINYTMVESAEVDRRLENLQARLAQLTSEREKLIEV